MDIYHLKEQSKEDDWDVTGINSEATRQAETLIRKTIASAKISEPFSVNLNEDIDTHKEAITNIAEQLSVHADFPPDSTGKLLLILKRFSTKYITSKITNFFICTRYFEDGS